MSTKFYPQYKIKKEGTFGDWVVKSDGTMIYKDGQYYIESVSLKEDDWILHLFEKNWIDWNDFMPAFFQACINAEIQFVKIKMFY